jgi:hypothetical protein
MICAETRTNANRGSDEMKKAVLAAIRLPVLLAVACSAAPGAVLAQDDVALKNAVQCKDFKHNRDGSWYAESVSLDYGASKKDQKQMNLFGATIKKGQAAASEPDLWAILNEKCGTAAH